MRDGDGVPVGARLSKMGATAEQRRGSAMAGFVEKSERSVRVRRTNHNKNVLMNENDDKRVATVTSKLPRPAQRPRTSPARSPDDLPD